MEHLGVVNNLHGSMANVGEEYLNNNGYHRRRYVDGLGHCRRAP